MPREESLQKASLPWVQLIDEEIHGITGPVKQHAQITPSEVAAKYGVPDDIMRKYLRLELEKEESCRSLPFTLIMVVSYTMMIVGHDPVVPINATEEAIIFDVEENGNFAFTSPYIGHKGMYDANSHADIWSWFIQGLAPIMFQQGRYGGWGEGIDMNDPLVEEANKPEVQDLKRADRGAVLNFNQLIGGLRVRQERGGLAECQTMSSLRKLYKRKCSDTYGGTGYEMYPEMATAKGTFSPQREFWLWAHDDVSLSLETLREKERANWLDSETTKIEVMIPIYNGQYGVYSIILCDFFFSHGGHIWKRIIPFSTYSQWFYGIWNIVPDLLWILGLMWIVASEGSEIYAVVSNKAVGGWKALKSEYLSFWNIVDWSNVLCGMYFIGGFFLRFNATVALNQDLEKLGLLNEAAQRETYREAAIELVDALEAEVKAADVFRVALGCYPILVVLRLFKAFSHQPRLSIVTKTLQSSCVDLLHFMFVFFSVFFTFAAAGVIIFGRDVDGFTHPIRAANTCFRIMMGDFDWDELNSVGRIEAGMWFAGFMVMIVILLLNMLLAIVMDAYSEQKAVIGDAETLWYELKLTLRRTRGIHKGQLRPLKEVYKAFRLIRAKEETWNVYKGMHKATYNSESSASIANRKAGFAKRPGLTFNFGANRAFKHCTTSGLGHHVETHKLITIENLMKNCSGLLEAQALEVIEGAACMYHTLHKETTNVEEMTRIIRKVDDGSEKIKVLLDEHDSQGHKGEDKGEAGDGEPAALLGPHAEHHELQPEDNDFLHHQSTEFEEQFWCCRADLRRATNLVGAEYPDHIHAEHLADFDKATGGKDLDYKGPMIMKPMVDLEEAADSTIKCILSDQQIVLDACADRGLLPDKDDLRIKSLGKAVRVMETDRNDNTVLCRVPAVGDVWFGLEALAHLRPKPAQDLDHHYFGQYGKHLSMQSAALATVDETGVEVMKATVEEQFRNDHSEALHKLHDLESELRVGRQTVAEAQAASKELAFQLDEDQKARLKFAQKLESLRRKVQARTREQNQLLETARHQEDRMAMVSKSRDDYLDLVHNLFDKKQKLADKLKKPAPISRERRHHEAHANGGRQNGHGHRERDRDRHGGRHDKESRNRHRSRSGSGDKSGFGSGDRTATGSGDQAPGSGDRTTSAIADAERLLKQYDGHLQKHGHHHDRH